MELRLIILLKFRSLRDEEGEGKRKDGGREEAAEEAEGRRKGEGRREGEIERGFEVLEGFIWLDVVSKLPSVILSLIPSEFLFKILLLAVDSFTWFSNEIFSLLVFSLILARKVVVSRKYLLLRKTRFLMFWLETCLARELDFL